MDNIRQKLNELLDLSNTIGMLDGLGNTVNQENSEQKHLLCTKNILWQKAHRLVWELSEQISQEATLAQSLIVDNKEDKEITTVDEPRVIITPLPKAEELKNEYNDQQQTATYQELSVMQPQRTDVVQFEKPHVPATAPSQTPTLQICDQEVAIEPKPIAPKPQIEEQNPVPTSQTIEQEPVAVPEPPKVEISQPTVRQSTVAELNREETPEQPVVHKPQSEPERKSWLSSVANKFGVSQKSETEPNVEPKLNVIEQPTSTFTSPKPTKIYDLKKNLGIADRFRFQRELFGGNGEKLSETLTAMNEMNSMEDVIQHVSMVLRWDRENPIVTDFVAFVKKKFD